jgi:hypothetical protein
MAARISIVPTECITKMHYDGGRIDTVCIQLDHLRGICRTHAGSRYG